MSYWWNECLDMFFQSSLTKSLIFDISKMSGNIFQKFQEEPPSITTPSKCKEIHSKLNAFTITEPYIEWKLQSCESLFVYMGNDDIFSCLVWIILMTIFQSDPMLSFISFNFDNSYPTCIVYLNKKFFCQIPVPQFDRLQICQQRRRLICTSRYS